METIRNIKKIALIFFITTGLLHLLSGLFYLNGYYIKYTYILYQVLDTPFLLSAVVYGLASLKLWLSDEKKSTNVVLDTVLIIIAIIVILSAIYINLFVPDRL